MNSEVAVLSVARAERDDIIMNLRSSLEQYDSKYAELKQEIQEIHVSLHEKNKENDINQKKYEDLFQQNENNKIQHRKEIMELNKNAELELEEATSHIEILLGKDIDMLKLENNKILNQMLILKKDHEKDISKKNVELERVVEEYEEAMRQMEDDNMNQISKVRAHSLYVYALYMCAFFENN